MDSKVAWDTDHKLSPFKSIQSQSGLDISQDSSQDLFWSNSLSLSLMKNIKNNFAILETHLCELERFFIPQSLFIENANQSSGRKDCVVQLIF
jgi:hypothetical protein